MQASELIVPSEGATCWENVTCTAQTRDHDGTRVYVPHMKVQCVYVTICVPVCHLVCYCMYHCVCYCVSSCVTVCVIMCVTMCDI